MRTAIVVSVLLAAFSFPDSTVGRATFKGLGDLPPERWTKPSAMSSDGSIIVGTRGVHPDMNTAFRWTAESGMNDLDGGGGPFVKTACSVNDLSGNGSILVGVGPTTENRIVGASLWTKAEGWSSLAELGPTRYAVANGISIDGSVVVGSVQSHRGGQAPTEAFRWSQETGIEGLGFLEGYITSAATDVSGDGRVVVGACSRGIVGRKPEWLINHNERNATAFRWTADTGMVRLVTVDDGQSHKEFASNATSVSNNGLVIVGALSYGKPGVRGRFSEAFRWCPEKGLVRLDHGQLLRSPIAKGSEALAVSGDGTRIVGKVWPVSSWDHEGRAFLWDEEHGMRLLDEVLTEDFDLNVDGWTLTAATAISQDGRVITGTGSRKAWVATIPALAQ